MAKRRTSASKRRIAEQIAAVKGGAEGAVSPRRRAQILKAQAKSANRRASAASSLGTNPALRIEPAPSPLTDRSGTARGRAKFVPKRKVW